MQLWRQRSVQTIKWLALGPVNRFSLHGSVYNLLKLITNITYWLLKSTKNQHKEGETKELGERVNRGTNGWHNKWQTDKVELKYCTHIIITTTSSLTHYYCTRLCDKSLILLLCNIPQGLDWAENIPLITIDQREAERCDFDFKKTIDNTATIFWMVWTISG